MAVQRRHVFIQRAENETAVFAHMGNLGQVVMRTVELDPIAALLIFDSDALAGTFVTPSVEPTGQSLCVALLERGDDRAAMGTRVEEYLDRAVFLAAHEHRLVANMCSIIISGVWYLAFVAQEIPDTLEAELQFRIVNIRVLENRPVQAKFMIRLGTIVNAVGKIDNRPVIRHRAGSVDAICAEV